MAPNYNIGWPFFDMMVRDHIMQYNYTLNPEGIYGAIKYMYTYYPDPNNKSHIREEFINVSIFYVFKVGGHSTTTCTEFCHSLTPPPLRGQCLYPELSEQKI